MQKREITPQELVELETFEKAVTRKSTHRRLQCVLLRAKYGWKREQIAQATGYHWRHVERVQQAYFEQGLLAFERKPPEVHPRQYLPPVKEAEFLQSLESEAEAGQLTSAKMIQFKLVEHLDHPVCLSTVYALLQRNGWSSKQPRPRHPKGDEEAKSLFKKIL